MYVRVHVVCALVCTMHMETIGVRFPGVRVIGYCKLT